MPCAKLGDRDQLLFGVFDFNLKTYLKECPFCKKELFVEEGVFMGQTLEILICCWDCIPPDKKEKLGELMGKGKKCRTQD